MGKVQAVFGNGSPGAISRSVDDIVISVKNAGEEEIPFGTPVFLVSGGAVPFDPGLRTRPRTPIRRISPAIPRRAVGNRGM